MTRPLEGADAEEYVSASGPYLGIDITKVVPEENPDAVYLRDYIEKMVAHGIMQEAQAQPAILPPGVIQ